MAYKLAFKMTVIGFLAFVFAIAAFQFSYAQAIPSQKESTAQTPYFLDEPERKDPFLAGLLSWSWNGLGQFYTQNYGRGSLFLMMDIFQKGLLVYGLFYYTDKYAASDEEVVRWNDISKKDRSIIIGYLFSIIFIKVLCVIDAVHSAETYNREIYFPYWKNRLRLQLSVETTNDRIEFSFGNHIQF
ncbi:MAG: hypothetical protein N2316_00360 [Spirochaetes bacterium]|nr:hypothetical protein [Spirochaetota bacterium]